MLNGITVYKQICDYSTARFQDYRRRMILLIVVPFLALTDTRQTPPGSEERSIVALFLPLK